MTDYLLSNGNIGATLLFPNDNVLLKSSVLRLLRFVPYLFTFKLGALLLVLLFASSSLSVKMASLCHSEVSSSWSSDRLDAEKGTFIPVFSTFFKGV